MAHVIAVAGKGGVGKTTLCGMLIQYLCEKGKGPILAVDADANSNLNEVLEVEVETTLGDVREEIARAELASENPTLVLMEKQAGSCSKRRSTLANWIIRKKLRNYWNSIFFGLSEIQKKNRN